MTVWTQTIYNLNHRVAPTPEGTVFHRIPDCTLDCTLEARTLDPMIKSHLLYQLSYGVMCMLSFDFCDAKLNTNLFMALSRNITFRLITYTDNHTIPCGPMIIRISCNYILKSKNYISSASMALLPWLKRISAR